MDLAILKKSSALFRSGKSGRIMNVVMSYYMKFY